MWFRRKSDDVLKEAPLGYWEKESYMLVVKDSDDDDFIKGMFDRISAIDGVEIKETRSLTVKEPGFIKLIYDDVLYEVGFYLSSFSFVDFYLNRTYRFTEEEIDKIKNAKTALTLYMKFGKDVKKSFHLQLKLAVAIVPNLIGVFDESAERLFPPKWVKMTANSNVVPSSSDLYTVQAINDDAGEVWLHTHGLCRCGITELEILQSDKKNYGNHYNLISALANYLIDKGSDFDICNDSAYIGVLINRQPIFVTCVSWVNGLKEYKKLKLGNVLDRKGSHNSRTSLIFIYKNEEDEKRRKISKVSFYDELWGDNPIFFVSTKETDRMRDLARERFDFVKNEANKEENQILIKIGLPVDDDGNCEHIWFELLEFKGDRFRAKLTQEPYNVEGIHEGDEDWYTVNDVTDWIIYTPLFKVIPGNAYLLEK